MPMVNPHLKVERPQLTRKGRSTAQLETYYLESLKNREEYRYDTMSDWDELPVSPKLERQFLRCLGVSK